MKSLLRDHLYCHAIKKNILTVRKWSLRQGNIFTSVCHSFCPWGVGFSACTADATHPTGMLSCINMRVLSQRQEKVHITCLWRSVIVFQESLLFFYPGPSAKPIYLIETTTENRHFHSCLHRLDPLSTNTWLQSTSYVTLKRDEHIYCILDYSKFPLISYANNSNVMTFQRNLSSFSLKAILSNLTDLTDLEDSLSVDVNYLMNCTHSSKGVILNNPYL